MKDTKLKQIPFLIENLGKLSRHIPNFLNLRGKLMWILMPKIRGRNFKTIIRYDLGQKISLDLDDWIPIQIFLTGFYFVEKKHTEYFKKLIKTGDVFFDIGAQIGYYTIIASTRVGKKGHVYSFEPFPPSFQVLRNNIQMNNFQNVSLYNLAVSDKKEYTWLYLQNRENSGSATFISSKQFFKQEKAGYITKVECTTIDDFIREKNIQKVDLIKIDTEGAEPKVLSGMQNLLSSGCPKILIEINEKQLNSFGYFKEYIYEYLSDRGYKAYDISGNKIKLISKYVEGNLVLFLKGNKYEREKF